MRACENDQNGNKADQAQREIDDLSGDAAIIQRQNSLRLFGV
jgi:hypothetical protein